MKTEIQSKMFGLEPEKLIDTGGASVHDRTPKLESKMRISKNSQFEGKRLLNANQWKDLEDWLEDNRVPAGKFTLRFVAAVAAKTDKSITYEMGEVFDVCPVPSPGESAIDQVAKRIGLTFGTRDRIG